MPYRGPSESRFEYVWDNPIPNIGAIQSKLTRALQSQDSVGWSRREENGRIDRRAFTRYATGEQNIFSRRHMKEAENAAVSILVDFSGSMTGRLIDTAQEVVINMSRMLDKTRSPFEVNGFRSSNAKTDVVNVPGDTYAAASSVTYISIKTWTSTVRARRAHLGAINQLAGGSTPDFDALRHKILEMASRPEQKKVLFFIGDSNGIDVDHMRYLQKTADKLGVRIAAIGIGYTKFSECFRNAADISNLDDIAGAGFKALLDAIK